MFKQLRAPEISVPLILLVLLYSAVIFFRPLLPIDETRYMSVAWEMNLRGDWLAPLTVNFQPYHHKPPLLFWLINMAWSVFGINRWAGTLPVLVSSAACIFLTRKLGMLLFPDNKTLTQNIPMLMIGSIVFLIYSLMVMFDITLTVFILLSLLALVTFAQSEKKKYLLWLALFMGLGVLTKGPVAWLYVIFPIALGPLWLPPKIKPLIWYGGCFAALILSVIPVLIWLIPVLMQSSDKFAYWLVWEQTAGRVTGGFNDAHVRPFWFYLPAVPILCLPWLFLPSFWDGLKNIKHNYKNEWAVRLLIMWVVPVFVAFSFISGKQPHYLVPLLPGVIILIALWLETSFKKIMLISTALVALVIAGQGVASMTVFKNYDLKPMSNYLQDHIEHDWAFVRKYHGELTFLGRLNKTVDNEQMETIDLWFDSHPNGLAIVRYDQNDKMDAYEKLFDMPYRGKRMGVFKRNIHITLSPVSPI